MPKARRTSDLIEIASIATQRTRHTCHRFNQPLLDAGFIYILQSYEHGWYKIGCTVNYRARAGQLNIAIPFRVRLAYCFYCHKHRAVERAIHQAYRSQRLNGEWFALDHDIAIAEFRGGARYTGFYEICPSAFALDPEYDVIKDMDRADFCFHPNPISLEYSL